MPPLGTDDQNKQLSIIFKTVYIGRFMIDRYFSFCTLQVRKICVTTQALKVKLYAINSIILFGANTDFTAISVSFFFFHNLLRI